MTYKEAIDKFREFVLKDRGLCVHEVNVIVKNFGWIFYYQSDLFMNSSDWLDGLIGNSPVFVAKTGEITYVHPTTNIDVFLQQWQEKVSEF